MNNRTCHPALQVHVIIGGEAPKQVHDITNRFGPLLTEERKKEHLFKILLNEKQSVRPLWARVVVAPGNRSSVRAGARRRSAAALQTQQEAQEQAENQRDHQVALTVRHLQENTER